MAGTLERQSWSRRIDGDNGRAVRSHRRPARPSRFVGLKPAKSRFQIASLRTFRAASRKGTMPSMPWSASSGCSRWSSASVRPASLTTGKYRTLKAGFWAASSNDCRCDSRQAGFPGADRLARYIVSDGLTTKRQGIKEPMLGAIAGDIIGSVHEGTLVKRKDFPLFVPQSCFTDDTVLTVAVASAILHGRDYGSSIREWGRRYPHAGYGAWFRDWLLRDEA